MGRPLKQSTAVTAQLGPALATDGITALTTAIVQANVQISKAGAAFAQKSEASDTTHDVGGFHRCAFGTADVSTLGPMIVRIGNTEALSAWNEFEVLDPISYDALYGTGNLRADAKAWNGDTRPLNALTTDGIAVLSTAQIVALATSQLGGLSSSGSAILSLAGVRVDGGTERGVEIKSTNKEAVYIEGAGSVPAVYAKNTSTGNAVKMESASGTTVIGKNAAGIAIQWDGGTTTSGAVIDVIGTRTIAGPSISLSMGGQGYSGIAGRIEQADTVNAVTGEVSANVVKWLGTAVSAALTATSIPAITAAQITTSQLGGQSTQYISALTTADLAAIATSGITTLPTTQLVALPTTQIVTLSTAQIVSLSTNQLVALPTTQIVSLPATYLGAQATQQVSSLVTADIDATITANTYIGNIRDNTFTEAGYTQIATDVRKYTMGVLTAGGLDGSQASDVLTRVLLATESISFNTLTNSPAVSEQDIGVLTGNGATNTWTPDAGWTGPLDDNLILVARGYNLETAATVVFTAKKTVGSFSEDITYTTILQPGSNYQTLGLDGVPHGLTSATKVANTATGGAGTGPINYTDTVLDSVTNLPIADVLVRMTTDIAGDNTVASDRTDALGSFTLNLDPGSYYIWQHKDGVNFTNPIAVTVSA